MNKLSIFSIFLLMYSCSSSRISDGISYKKNYWFVDGQGRYDITQQHYIKKNNIITRYKLQGENDEGIKKVFEENDLISEIGTLNKETKSLQPRYSKFSIWIDKQKHTSIIQKNMKDLTFKVKFKRGDSSWKSERVELPKENNGLFCFFSQIVECMKINLFIEKAIDKKVGVAKFSIIWDGYPFRQEIYEKMPVKLITSAEFRYEGKKKNKTEAFGLHFGDQAITYQLDENMKLKNMYWINQGISIQPKR